MAAPELPLISVEEYLNTRYPDGDRECVDGVVVERNMGTFPHGLLQLIVAEHLRLHRKFYVRVRGTPENFRAEAVSAGRPS